MEFEPRYLKMKKEELLERIKLLEEIIRECRLCPRECKVKRLNGELGFCKAGRELMVSSVFPHFGEEQPLVGRRGSGTIFLTHCNLKCIFCQNYDISHLGEGEITSQEEMARSIIGLQKRGCHNINFVTPTHYVPQIIAVLPRAIEMGLNIPLVYNCGGYESLEVIKILDGIIDIYMPDCKFSDDTVAKKYAHAPDYPRVVKEVLKEMHNQVGDLRINKEGIAEKGLLIRHLVMPNGLAGTKELMEFIAKEISPHSFVNVMEQYHPEYRACEFPEISRRISLDEFLEARKIARNAGLYRGF
jgi:putative pyruvate formate lyase activating enzyme